MSRLTAMSKLVEAGKKEDEAGRCMKCGKDLAGHRYILHEQKSYCIACYESKFSNSCFKCKTLIGADTKDLTYKNHHWHESCFICSECEVPLIEQPFTLHDSKIYCSNCFSKKSSYVCEACKQPFKQGTSIFDFNGKHWHENCFKCVNCEKGIGSKHFIPVKDQPVCQKCYEKFHAHKCVKCSKVITKGGLTYRDQPWHRECFVCSHCSRSLADVKFRSNEEQPYCISCHLALFAKRCEACGNPIGGEGEVKFVTYNGRDWHTQCFRCSKCNKNQLGKPFLLINDGRSLLCKTARKILHNVTPPCCLSDLECVNRFNPRI